MTGTEIYKLSQCPVAMTCTWQSIAFIYLENRAGIMVQALERLPSKLKVQSSNPSTSKKELCEETGKGGRGGC